MKRLLGFLNSFHPIVHTLLIGTVLARAASSMSLPFLAIYLAETTKMGPVMIGVTTGLGSLAGTLGGFVGGALSDRFGRKVIMLGSLYMWGAVFIGFGISTEVWLFMLLNALNGLCRSFFEPVSQALLGDLTPPDRRFRVFSLRYTAINVGVAIGPLLGALFGLVDGRLPWLITGSFYLLYAVVLGYLLNRLGLKGSQGVPAGAQPKEGITLRSVFRVIRKDKALGLFIAAGIIVAIGYSQMSVTLSQYLEDEFVNGVKLFAVLMSVNAVAVIAFQLPFSRWAERRTPFVSIALGCCFYAAGDLGFAFSGGWTGMIISMVIFTWGEIFTFPAGSLLVDRLAPEGLRGAYYGAQQFSNLGHFIGPWFGGLLLASFGGPTMFVTVGAIALCSIWFYSIGERAVAQR